MTPPAQPTLIETVRVRQGVAPLWALHRARLKQSAAALGIRVPSAFEPPVGGEDRAVRMVINGSGVMVSSRDVGSMEPVQLRVVQVPHPGYPHKVVERAAFDAARTEAQAAGADDALLLTADGMIAETSIWALGWWEEDGLYFPPLSSGVLPSVGRARVSKLVPVRDAFITPAALVERAALVVNAVRGVVAVRGLDGVSLPEDPRTDALQSRFWPQAGPGIARWGS